MKLSICTIAYKQEKYIAQALESFLMQKTSFNFEIVICDDNSGDRTADIVNEYSARYPGRIRLFVNEKNKGMKKNFFDAIRKCEGEYIAFCEGDDYWEDPEKLQKQVDFLEAHKDVALCFSDVRQVDENNNYLDYVITDMPYEILPPHKILTGFWTPTLSVCVRRQPLLEAVEKMNDDQFVLNLDWVTFSLVEERGKIGYVKTIPSCYRQHQGGIFSAKSHKEKLRSSLQSISYLRSLLKEENIRYLKEAELGAYNVHMYNLVGVQQDYWAFIKTEIGLLARLVTKGRFKLAFKAVKDFFVIIRVTNAYKRKQKLKAQNV